MMCSRKNRTHRFLYKLLTVFSALTVLASSAYAGSGTRLEGDAYLNMDLQQLMEITITSVSKKPQKLQDVPAAAFVISQEDIRRSGVTTLADALAMVPGIHVAKINSSKWSVSSRGLAGFTSNKLLILIDGRSVYSPVFGGTYWDSQNVMLEDVERIEVVRGPGGTLWGANAVNGVINIITKSARNTQGNLVRGGIGTKERYQGAVRTGDKVGENTYGRLYAMYNKRQANSKMYLNDTIISKYDDARDGWQNMQAGFRLDGEIDSRKMWTVQGDVSKTNGDQIIYPYWTENYPQYDVAVYELDSKGANIVGRWEQRLDAEQKITVQAYIDHVDRDEDQYALRYTTYDLELQYDLPVNSFNNLTTGAGIRYLDGEQVKEYRVSLHDNSGTLYSAFLQDEITLLPELLRLTIGAKWEHNEFTGNEWQPGVRLLYTPSETHSVWMSVARAVRTPSYAERTGRGSVGVSPAEDGSERRFSFVGSGEFESEYMTAYETGYRWQIDANLNVDLALFYNGYSDVYLIKQKSENEYTIVNGLDGNRYGVELASEWQATDSLLLNLAYAYRDGRFKVKNPADLDTSVDNTTPKHSVSLQTSYKILDNVLVNVWLRYQSSFKTHTNLGIVSYSPDIDQMFLLDANIIWQITDKLELMLCGQNIFNDSEYQYKTEIMTPTTEIDRGGYLKLTYMF